MGECHPVTEKLMGECLNTLLAGELPCNLRSFAGNISCRSEYLSYELNCGL